MDSRITTASAAKPALRRVITLPWLVCYGVGVTIGAGIFALIGEIMGIAGDGAPMSFLIAGVIAAFTGLSYALLVSEFPKAGGEAVFVNRGLGHAMGWLAGMGVAIVGIVSSAVIALAFAGYASAVLPIPQPVLVIAVLALLTGVAIFGVRESVLFAAIVTVLEVGTLLVVIAAGLPLLQNLPPPSALAGLSGGTSTLALAFSGGVIAFFAFIGFEDIENMAEETVDPAHTAPRAIFWTLGITVFVYVLLALVAVSAPGRDAITGSSAPVAVLFETVTGFGGQPVAVMASIAMINGILVQIIMAARVLYGMSNEGLAPRWFAAVHPGRHTPMRATLFVSGLILFLALLFPLLQLAQLTSLITLAVFAMVNVSLFVLGTRGKHARLVRWRWWGIAGAALCVGLIVFQIASGTIGGH